MAVALEIEIGRGVSSEEAYAALVGELAQRFGLPLTGAYLQECLDDSLEETLQKALPAHPGHYRLRDREGRFTSYHPGRVALRDERGRFRGRLSPQECDTAVTQARVYVGELSQRLSFTQELRARDSISAEEWEALCARDIRTFYTLIYRCGKQSVGDPAVQLTAQDMAVLNRLVKDELGYLKEFGAAQSAGSGSMPYSQRMELYGRAAREAALLGFVMGDQRKRRALRWVLGPTEKSCRDCLRFSKMGWTPVLKFIQQVVALGYVPQSGALECRGSWCQCRLEERVNGEVRSPNFLGE